MMLEHHLHADEQGPAREPDRRDFLAASAAVASVALLVAASPLAIGPSLATDANTAFLQLARFLTGRADLDARIAARAHDAFVAADSTFDRKMAALLHAINEMGLPNADRFAASALYADSNHRTVAVAMVSAFYLGQVGTGKAAKFVAFETALMFEPTADVVGIPTYAQGGPGYWAKITTFPHD